MKVSNIVEESLRDYDKCRDSDRYLMLVVWHRLGFKLTFEQRQQFMKMPSAETIRRIRQKLQEDGKYPASEATRKKRHLKSLIVQQNIPKARVESTERVVEQVPML